MDLNGRKPGAERKELIGYLAFQLDVHACSRMITKFGEGEFTPQEAEILYLQCVKSSNAQLTHELCKKPTIFNLLTDKQKEELLKLSEKYTPLPEPKQH